MEWITRFLPGGGIGEIDSGGASQPRYLGYLLCENQARMLPDSRRRGRAPVSQGHRIWGNDVPLHW
jgi:hypothetical protein